MHGYDALSQSLQFKYDLSIQGPCGNNQHGTLSKVVMETLKRNYGQGYLSKVFNSRRRLSANSSEYLILSSGMMTFLLMREDTTMARCMLAVHEAVQYQHVAFEWASKRHTRQRQVPFV